MLASQTGAGNQDNLNSSNELITRKEVTGTPFIIVGEENHGYMITLGRYQLSRRYKTIDECYELIGIRDWELMMNLMSVFVEGYNMVKDEQERIKELQKEIPQG